MGLLSNSPDINLFKKNIEFFKTFSPAIYQGVLANKPGNFKLTRIGDTDFDVEVGGKNFYGGPAVTVTERQIHDFWQKQQNRLHFQPEQEEDVYGVVSRFFDSLMRKAADSDVTFFEKRCDLRSYHLVVFGVGLGIHLPMLVDRLECRVLTIVEPDLDLFHASLHKFDWQALKNRFPEERGYHLNVMISNDPVFVFDYVRNIVRYQRNPAFLDGFCLFQHYDTDMFQRVASRIFKEPETLFSNFGFLYDDMNMVQNTYFNLRDHTPLIFRGAPFQIDVPAFVVGAGPSLDQSIETIRSLQDRAIIISCGTGLQALVEGGILPDFHTELENDPDTYNVTAEIAKRHDISRIHLVGSTSVFPTVPGLFNKSLLFFRGGVASDPMFKVDDCSEIPHCSPLVSNLGVSLAGELGCRKIYLFGIDLGTVNREVHYATNTLKSSGEFPYHWGDGVDLKVPGNFGGTAFTHPDFIDSRTYLEEDIRYNGTKRQYFNCSDGIAIAGAIPLRPKDISLLDAGVSKSAAIDAILSRGFNYTPDMFRSAWNGDERLAANKRIANRLMKTLLVGGEGYKETINNLISVSHELPVETDIPEILLYRGSMITALATAYFFLCRTGNEADRAKFSAIVRNEMAHLITNISERVDSFYCDLKNPESAKLKDYIEIH